MTTLQNKIDFALILCVKNANPNGDPLNGNRPRTDYSGNGEITDDLRMRAAPELPFGYAGSILLALAPPLWRRVMDSKALAWRT